MNILSMIDWISFLPWLIGIVGTVFGIYQANGKEKEKERRYEAERASQKHEEVAKKSIETTKLIIKQQERTGEIDERVKVAVKRRGYFSD